MASIEELRTKYDIPAPSKAEQEAFDKNPEISEQIYDRRKQLGHRQS